MLGLDGSLEGIPGLTAAVEGVDVQVNQAAGQSFSGPAVLSTLAGKGTLDGGADGAAGRLVRGR